MSRCSLDNLVVCSVKRECSGGAGSTKRTIYIPDAACPKLATCDWILKQPVCSSSAVVPLRCMLGPSSVHVHDCYANLCLQKTEVSCLTFADVGIWIDCRVIVCMRCTCRHIWSLIVSQLKACDGVPVPTWSYCTHQRTD